MMQPGSTSGWPESVLLQDITLLYGCDVLAHMLAARNFATASDADVALRWLSCWPSMYSTGMGSATLKGSAATGDAPLKFRCWASLLWARMLTSSCAPELWAMPNTRFCSLLLFFCF